MKKDYETQNTFYSRYGKRLSLCYWRDRYGFKPENFPGAYDCFRRAVSLPIYSKMTDEDWERVIAAVVKESAGDHYTVRAVLGL